MPRPPVSTLDLLQYVAATTHTTGSLCCRFMGGRRQGPQEIISKLLSDSMLEVVRFSGVNILLITEEGKARVSVRDDLTFPRRVTRARLPTMTIHHNLYAQYAFTQLCNRHDLLRYSFDYRLSDNTDYRPDVYFSFKDSRRDGILEMEMTAKSDQRVYMKFMDVYRALKEIDGAALFVFPSAPLRDKYQELFRVHDWPVYSSEKGGIVKKGTFPLTAEIYELFRFVTIQELDGKSVDYNRIY